MARVTYDLGEDEVSKFLFQVVTRVILHLIPQLAEVADLIESIDMSRSNQLLDREADVHVSITLKDPPHEGQQKQMYEANFYVRIPFYLETQKEIDEKVADVKNKMRNKIVDAVGRRVDYFQCQVQALKDALLSVKWQ